MEINMKEFNKWIAALRSGKYEQTKGALQDENGYCCLGVACEVLIPKKSQELWEDGSWVGTFPSHQDNAPDWLKRINGKFHKYTRLSLSTLNDEKDASFDEIADMLEAVFVHKVLEEL